MEQDLNSNRYYIYVGLIILALVVSFIAGYFVGRATFIVDKGGTEIIESIEEIYEPEGAMEPQNQ